MYIGFCVNGTKQLFEKLTKVQQYDDYFKS